MSKTIDNKKRDENLKNCVIWTRVSTKYQEDNGASLKNQNEICEQYARRNGYHIVGHYGGSHESAKTAGKLLREMISAVKNNKTISHIIVSETDRLSRNAGQAITILDQLKQLNVTLVDATAGIKTDTSCGTLMIQIKTCSAQWDNTNRTDKFVSGRRYCMENGVWCNKTPFGYTKTGKSLNSRYRINDTGRLIQMAFEWKLAGETNNRIIKHLASYGLRISKQRLHKILVNPFYAGKIKSKLVPELVDGNQETIISYPQFLRVQDILSGRTGKYIQAKETPRFPLKHYVLCSEDHTPLTAYTVKAKNIDYYKCNRQGCQTNIAAKKLHNLYADMLDNYQIPQELLEIFRDIIRRMIIGNQEEKAQHRIVLRKQLTETENHIKDCKIRFGMGEIDRDVYQLTINTVSS